MTGTYTYIHNVRVPGMLHARVVRPRGQGSYGGGSATNILSVDASSVAHLPGVEGRCSAATSSAWSRRRSTTRSRRRRMLKVTYGDPPTLSELAATSTSRCGPGHRRPDAGTDRRRSRGNIDAAYAAAANKVTATYKYQYNGHMPIGPTCAVADVTSAGRARDCEHTGRLHDAQQPRTTVLGLPLNNIRVQYWEGSSTFGNAPARHDGGLAAAVASQLAGAPVRLQFMRWDEHGWDNFGPPQLADMRGAVDANGNIVAYEMTQFMPPGISQTADNPTRQHVGLPIGPLGLGALDTTNSGTQYNLPNRRVIGKTLPGTSYFKTSTMRAPQAPQTCFASEQFIDELAYAAKMDPYQFRLQNITDDRPEPAGTTRWSARRSSPTGSRAWRTRSSRRATIRTGRGIALGSFGGSQAGAVVEITVNMKTGKITRRRRRTPRRSRG